MGCKHHEEPQGTHTGQNPSDCQDIQLVLSIKPHINDENAGLLQLQNSSTHTFLEVLGFFYYDLSPIFTTPWLGWQSQGY